MDQILRGRAINANVFRTYIDGDNYQAENRLPEVGATACFRDGRKYVFCSSTGSHALGKTVAAPANTDTTVDGAWTAGVRTIDLVGAGVTANQFKDAYITFSGDSAGTYVIVSNTATDGGSFTVELDRDLESALTDTGAVEILPYRYSGVGVGGANDDIVGFVIVPITAVAGKTQYFWVQTAGMMMSDVGKTPGDALMPAAAGATATATAGNPVIARAITSRTLFVGTDIE